MQANTAPKLKWRELRIDQIDVPREYRRTTPNKDADSALTASVKLSGVHQPLAVIPNGQRFLLVKGTRRLNAAELNGLAKVPVVINFPPPGLSPKEVREYRDRLRFILDSKRQDLTPSQRVAVINEAQRDFGMNNKEIAAMLGFHAASVTLWKRIEDYAKPIVAAIDNGEMTLHHADAFRGLKPAGQLKAFSEFRSAIPDVSGRKFHAMVRSRYNPTKTPDLFLEPEKTAQRVAKHVSRRKQVVKARRSPPSKAELERLENDLELLQIEHDENARQIKHADRLLMLWGPIHRAVSQDDELSDYIAQKYPDTLLALERASEIA